MSGWRKRQVVELAERASPSKQDWWKDDDALEAFAELVREDEREACAVIAEEWLGPTKDRELHIAAAIRARGQA
jgi:hypothetical protein